MPVFQSGKKLKGDNMKSLREVININTALKFS
jgi:hypothetical protein